MRAGIPLSKTDAFCELLEEHAYSLSGSQHMREFIKKEEKLTISKEVRQKHVSVIFDGTAHVSEAMAIVV